MVGGTKPRQKERGPANDRTRRSETGEQATTAGNQGLAIAAPAAAVTFIFRRSSDVTAKAFRGAPHRRTRGQPRKRFGGGPEPPERLKRNCTPVLFNF
jgi:hypothetical protein